jgi:hypothetical protein
MNVGLWMAPTLLVGLSAFLWAAARLERLTAPPALAHGVRVEADELRPISAVTRPQSPPVCQAVSRRGWKSSRLYR